MVCLAAALPRIDGAWASAFLCFHASRATLYRDVEYYAAASAAKGSTKGTSQLRFQVIAAHHFRGTTHRFGAHPAGG
jgi:hypothetical protein